MNKTIKYFIFFSIIFFISIKLSNSSNIIVFNSDNYISGHIAINSKGDMLIEYSVNGKRLFYGLKQNGKYFFNNNPILEKPINYAEGTFRYESKNIFVNINNKEYLFTIGSYTSVVELWDFNDVNNITYDIKLTSEFLGHQMFSFVL